MTDLPLTVCTPTVGESAWRLRVMFDEMRRFTSIPFAQVVCDDGTLCNHALKHQRDACDRFGCTWVQNPGPVWGISYNLNYLLDQVKTPWAFLLEDGLRPSRGWLEAALEFIDKIGSRTFGGHGVGMAGCSSLQDWLLVMGKAIPSVFPGKGLALPILNPVDCWKNSPVKQFYEDWNDGYFCWNRLLPGIHDWCRRDIAWEGEPLTLVKIALEGFEAGAALHPAEDRPQLWQKWRTQDHWPARRTAGIAWKPGAFMLLNMDAWRAVGRMRDGCTFFEAHLGTRMGLAGYLSLYLEFPPWLHTPSIGFREAPAHRLPRDHRDTEKVFLEDFGCTHMQSDALCDEVIGVETMRRVGEQLAAMPLTCPEGWKKYLEVQGG